MLWWGHCNEYTSVITAESNPDLRSGRSLLNRPVDSLGSISVITKMAADWDKPETAW
ncbi:MAG: hypothetical protein ACMUEM_05950 [Flavobacteriales bacterium AspAUS03]